jgi:glutathione S-transferase
MTKLYYFDIRNLGEMIRMILEYAQVPYEDIRIAQEDWPEFKERMGFKHLPVLEEDGKYLTESTAIARYLGRKYGMSYFVGYKRTVKALRVRLNGIR